MTLKSCKQNCKRVNNQLEFYAMMRSGQHAIMHWIFAQIKEPIYFHNDILCHDGKKAYLDRGRWINVNSNPPIKTFPWYAYNMEDISIENIDEIKEKYREALYIVPPKRETKILIIRDPFNLFASRYRFFGRLNTIRVKSRKKRMPKTKRTNANSKVAWFDDRAFYRWKEYAREALGETDFLGDKIIINYNHWFKHERYRKKISAKLGVNFSDEKLNFIPNNGYGSSFDTRDKNDDAQKMKVLDRWKRFGQHDMFKEFFNDYEMINLSLKLWPGLTKKVIKEMNLLTKKIRNEMGL